MKIMLYIYLQIRIDREKWMQKGNPLKRTYYFKNQLLSFTYIILYLLDNAGPISVEKMYLH